VLYQLLLLSVTCYSSVLCRVLRMSAAEEDIHELDSETENDGLNDVEMCLMSEVGEFVHLYINLVIQRERTTFWLANNMF